MRNLHYAIRHPIYNTTLTEVQFSTMAKKRGRQVKRTNTTKPPLFPPEVTSFFKERFKEGCGIALVIFSAFCFGALISYHSADPSLNTGTTSDSVLNYFGLPGALVADIFLQSVGFASFVFCLITLSWGYRLVRRREMSIWGGRIIALTFATLIIATALAPFDFHIIDAKIQSGGIWGQLSYAKIEPLSRKILSPYFAYAVPLSLLFIGCISAIFSVAFSREEWSAGIHRFFAVMGFLADITMITLHSVRRFVVMLWCHFTDRELDEEIIEDKPATAPITLKREKPVMRKEPPVTKEKVEPTVVVPMQSSSQKDAKRNNTSMSLFMDEGYTVPPLDLLQLPSGKQKTMSESALKKNAEILHSVLNDFGVNGDIVKVNPGPVVTLYELEPAPGLKSSRVINLSDDIARSMSAVSVRVAVVPGQNVIGIELPNKNRETVYLREIIDSADYTTTKMRLPLVLGKNIAGKSVIADLSRMPHLLVAGTTGSGKSVGVNAMILSLLYRLSPEKCRLILIDPKMLELSIYDDIPHLLTPVVTDPKKAIVALKWAVREMEDRYRAMSKLGVRNIEGYNARIEQARKKGEVLSRRVQTGFDPDTGKPIFEDQPMDMTELPYIVVVVDEFADLMLVAGKEVEGAIQRLAQMARAAGIHLIMATQRPSVDVITGTIKANFPSRISFQVTSRIDSRTILGDNGAENLLGLGDMLYMSGGGRITRVHGPFVADKEVEDIVAFLQKQGVPNYIDDVVDEESDFASGGISDMLGGGSKNDELYDKAVNLVLSEGKASTSFVQRHLSIGYNRAATIIERMEKEGVISPANHVGKRDVLVGDNRR